MHFGVHFRKRNQFKEKLQEANSGYQKEQGLILVLAISIKTNETKIR